MARGVAGDAVVRAVAAVPVGWCRAPGSSAPVAVGGGEGGCEAAQPARVHSRRVPGGGAAVRRPAPRCAACCRVAAPLLPSPSWPSPPPSWPRRARPSRRPRRGTSGDRRRRPPVWPRRRGDVVGGQRCGAAAGVAGTADGRRRGECRQQPPAEPRRSRRTAAGRRPADADGRDVVAGGTYPQPRTGPQRRSARGTWRRTRGRVDRAAPHSGRPRHRQDAARRAAPRRGGRSPRQVPSGRPGGTGPRRSAPKRVGAAVSGRVERRVRPRAAGTSP